MAYPATPKTWVAGDVLTAAQLNAELRDALLAIFPLGPPDVAWTAFTPTLTQGVTVTKTVTYARYMKVGRTVLAQVRLAVTGAGTAGTKISAGLPPPAGASDGPVGVFHFVDASFPNNYTGMGLMEGGNSVIGMPSGFVAGFGQTSSQTAVALASGDTISYAVCYEATS